MAKKSIKTKEDFVQFINQASSQKLERIDLSQRKLNGIPKEIGQLKALKSLIVSGNEIEELPKEIGQLTQLERLYLGGNRLQFLPSEIGRLKNLKRLYLGRNEIQELPDEIGQLKSLQRLGLGDNAIKTIPATIKKLTNLDRIILGGNCLEQLPKEITRLTKLKYLDLSRNKLSDLPDGIEKLPCLEKVVIKGNGPLMAQGFFIPEMSREVLQLFVEHLQAKRDNFIIRSLEFPSDLYQSGITVLNYFGTIIRQKYPNEDITVRIEQEGKKICMIIETAEGQREVIEQTLKEYGLVVSGKLPPEELLDDKLHVVQLKNKLKLARMEIEFQLDKATQIEASLDS